MELAQAQFHGGFFYIERIHKILLRLNEVTARRNNDAAQMAADLRVNYNLLNDLFKELSGKMDKKIRAEHLEAAQLLKNDLEKTVNTYKTERTIPAKFEQKLDGWELELRQFAEKKGLLVPDKMSPGEALGM